VGGTAAGIAAGVGGRAGEDAARPSADTGSLPAESDAAGPGFSVHADSGLGSQMGLSPPQFTQTNIPARAATPTPVSDFTTF